MTSRSSIERYFGIVAIIALGITAALLTLPRAASAAEVTTTYENITSAEELAGFFNADAPTESPNAAVTSEGVVTLLEPVTVTGDYGVYLQLSEDEPITLDLGGQTLSLENGTTEYYNQLIAHGAGTLTLTGEGSLSITTPADQELVCMTVIGPTVNVACDITMQRAESSSTTIPFVYLGSGAITVSEGGALRQAVTDSGQSYTGSYNFISCGYDDNPDPAALTVDGGTIAVADDHWGVAANDNAAITITSGEVSHHSTKLVGDEYADALLAVRSGSITMSGGTVGPETAIDAKSGGTVTMAGGALFGVLYGEDAGTTLTVSEGDIYGYVYTDDDFDALDVSNGATATMTGGAVRADVYAAGQGSNVTITGGVVSGQLHEVDGGTITVTTDPQDLGSGVFTYPVPPTMLSGIAASGTVLDEREVVFIDYYATLEAARQDIASNYDTETTVTGYCATTSPEAVIDFAGFGASGPMVNSELELYKSWLGEDIPAADGAKMWVFASVVPGQTYTITFTDETGATIGEQTQTVDADESTILCMIDVSAPVEMQPVAGTEPPTITAGTYTVSVTPTDGQTATCDFGVSSISLDLNGGYISGGDESYGVLTGLYPPAKWSLAGSSTAAKHPGYKLTGWTSEPEGYVKTMSDGTLYSPLPLFTGEKITLTAQWAPDVVEVSRLWNPNNGAHLLTTEATEVSDLEDAGWKDEGVIFSVYGSAYPDSTPVTRLYNPNNGDHLYSTSALEVSTLVDGGWVDEGVKFYGSPDKNYPVYRLWNSYQTADGGLGSHLWTADHNEYITLPQLPPVGAWQQEGVVWYAVSLPNE